MIQTSLKQWHIGWVICCWRGRDDQVTEVGCSFLPACTLVMTDTRLKITPKKKKKKNRMAEKKWLFFFLIPAIVDFALLPFVVFCCAHAGQTQFSELPKLHRRLLLPHQKGPAQPTAPEQKHTQKKWESRLVDFHSPDKALQRSHLLCVCANH